MNSDAAEVAGSVSESTAAAKAPARPSFIAASLRALHEGAVRSRAAQSLQQADSVHYSYQCTRPEVVGRRALPVLEGARHDPRQPAAARLPAPRAHRQADAEQAASAGAPGRSGRAPGRRARRLPGGGRHDCDAPGRPARGARSSVTALAVERLEERAERTVRVDRLLVRFAEVQAVAGISFDVRAGEVFGLLGPNGAGKTTTIRVLTTLLRPDGGRALVAGHDVVREGLAVRQAIGYVPQAISIDGALTAHENLEFYARATGVPRRERRERIAQAVEAMYLESFLDRLGRTLSGGMLRRREIATPPA